MAGATPPLLSGDGLYGCGRIQDSDGVPLRPGGRTLTEQLLDHAGFSRGDLVLDIGCGQGQAVEQLIDAGLQAIGIDVDPEALLIARGRVPRAAFLDTSGDQLSMADGTVDGILAECSLSVMPDRRQALAEWARVLRGGGVLALSDVYRRSQGPAGSCLADRATLMADLTAAGFEVLRFEDRSDVLRSWVVRFIFQYGSLDRLWGGACGLSPADIKAKALGYCVAIARRSPVEREVLS